MRNIIIGFLVTSAALLQMSFFGAMRPFGIIPNLAIILITWLSVLLDDGELVIVAAALGIIFDLSSGVDFGLRTTFYLLYCLVLLVVRQVGGDFEYLPAGMLAIALGALAYNVALAGSLLVSGQGVAIGYYTSLAAREIALDLVFAVLLRPIIGRLLGDAGNGQLIRRS